MQHKNKSYYEVTGECTGWPSCQLCGGSYRSNVTELQ